MTQNKSFRHESLQDRETVQELLDALTQSIQEGRIVLEDDENEIIIEPQGLANLKITATQDGKKNRLNIRLTWYEEREPLTRKKIAIRGA